jgi:hypothetical protein
MSLVLLSRRCLHVSQACANGVHDVVTPCAPSQLLIIIPDMYYRDGGIDHAATHFACAMSLSILLSYVMAAARRVHRYWGLYFGQMPLNIVLALRPSDLANRLTHRCCGSPRYHKFECNASFSCAVFGITAGKAQHSAFHVLSHFDSQPLEPYGFKISVGRWWRE